MPSPSRPPESKNRHAIRPSRSLGLLYDHRNEKSKLAKLVVLESEKFRDIVEIQDITPFAQEQREKLSGDLQHLEVAQERVYIVTRDRCSL